MDLYNIDRHEPLNQISWDAHKLEKYSEYILNKTIAQFSPKTYWPVHPLDSEVIPPVGFTDFYYGAGGIFWLLENLNNKPKSNLKNESLSLIEGLTFEDTTNVSFFFDSIAFLLFKEKIDPAKRNRDTLYNLLNDSPENNKNEILYGTPSTLLVAYNAYKMTKENRFLECCQRFKNRIFDSWNHDTDKDCYLWTQNFESSNKYIGAAHGASGNINVLYTVKDILNPNELTILNERASRTFERLATSSDEYANWPIFADSSNKFLLHWCHGAPGVICALADHLPSNQTTDELFIKGAELIWKAGPLKKGTSICHGTSGNALALLKIYKRTRDEKWLIRAQAFAMHCLDQCSDLEKNYGQLRYSLWTGDLGLVWLNEQIKNKTADLPILDIY